MMEDNKPADSTQNNDQNNQIMDIAPPAGTDQNVTFSDNSPYTQDDSTRQANAVEQLAQENALQPVDQAQPPQPPASQEEVEPAANPIPAMPAGLEEPENTQSQPDSQQPQSDTKPKKQPGKKGPVLVITIAIIVMLGMAAAAVMLYLQQNPAEAPGTSDNSQQQEEVDTVPPATEEDVNNVIKNIDELENLNDKEDFSDESLNDDKLGL